MKEHYVNLAICICGGRAFPHSTVWADEVMFSVEPNTVKQTLRTMMCFTAENTINSRAVVQVGIKHLSSGVSLIDTAFAGPHERSRQGTSITSAE